MKPRKKNHYHKNQFEILKRVSASELNSCPFCRGTHLEWSGITEEGFYDSEPIKLFFIQCNECGSRGPVTSHQHPITSHKLWNLRS